MFHIWSIPSTPWQCIPLHLDRLHYPQRVDPHCKFIWKVYIWTGGERPSIDDEYVERVGGWWDRGLPLFEPHPSFSFFPIVNLFFVSSKRNCRSFRCVGLVAQRSTFEQNGNRCRERVSVWTFGWVCFFHLPAIDGRQKVLWCAENCSSNTKPTRVYHPQWYLFSFYSTPQQLVNWIWFSFDSFHFISGANFWKRYSSKERKKRKFFKWNALFFHSLVGFLFTARCYIIKATFYLLNAGSFIFHLNSPSIERNGISVLLSSSLLKGKEEENLFVPIQRSEERRGAKGLWL